MISDFESQKHEILGDIFLKKEDTLKKLEDIVKKSQRDFLIDMETLEILFKDHIKKIPEQILRLLIAFFLMKEKGLTKTDSIGLGEISKRLRVKKTSLSKPLGNLIKKGFVKKDDDRNYSIVHYKILEILDRGENA